jgi:hypothetical protein
MSNIPPDQQGQVSFISADKNFVTLKMDAQAFIILNRGLGKYIQQLKLIENPDERDKKDIAKAIEMRDQLAGFADSLKT